MPYMSPFRFLYLSLFYLAGKVLDVHCVFYGYIRNLDVYKRQSIKNVADTRVGDTVMDNDNLADEPLPGYKSITPMVYCGIYPADGSKYEDLKEALGKLKLNDASLLYEPETSVALGFGFRCGFLGLLHLEVTQQRIDREYNLDIVTTTPSVIYLSLIHI